MDQFQPKAPKHFYAGTKYKVTFILDYTCFMKTFYSQWMNLPDMETSALVNVNFWNKLYSRFFRLQFHLDCTWKKTSRAERLRSSRYLAYQFTWQCSSLPLVTALVSILLIFNVTLHIIDPHYTPRYTFNVSLLGWKFWIIVQSNNRS